MKTEQVVLEFLYKVAELIIQSRVTFESDLDSRRATRRARVRPPNSSFILHGESRVLDAL